MSDLGDYFRDWKEHKQKKKQANALNSTKLLQDAEITFASHNDGIHLVVGSMAGPIDFWPSTGKWIVRKTKFEKRGVLHLITFVKKSEGVLP